jgi:endonuclease/exonuclease/phosphatase (EEP) superfamily protein YafD
VEPFLVGLGAVLIAATALAFLRHQSWWIRACDFPRLQIAVALLAVFVVHLLGVESTPLNLTFRAALLACLAVQMWRMFPFTRLASVQVQTSEAADTGNGIKLLFANVLETNRNAAALLALIREADPDVILALETDAWWKQQLDVLTATHAHTVLQPQNNTYGMVLYSRLPLLSPEVRFLIQEDVPSIHTQVRLVGGAELRLHCLHPRPPSPTEADSSSERDAELLMVGRAIKKDPRPTIVMGDMNDVAWSHTSDLFRKISGLLDPRVGRGFFNTFNAKHWAIRFPLDHFFHSNDFRLIQFRRLGYFGSDHFPVYIHLSHEPDAEAEQPEHEADASERQEAAEKIAEVDASAHELQ